jgi:hypothetical protein
MLSVQLAPVLMRVALRGRRFRMRKDRQQLWLRIAAQSPARLTPEAERELVQALADLLLAVATTTERDQQGGNLDEHQDR